MSCAAILLPAMASASPLDNLARALDVPAIDLSHNAAGDQVTWSSAEQMRNGDIVFHQAEFKNENEKLIATKLILTENGFHGEGLSVDGIVSGLSTTGLRAATFSGEGPKAYEILMGNSDICAGDTQMPTGGSEVAARFTAQGVEMSPPEFSGSDAIIGSSNMEKVRFGSLEVGLSSWVAEDCSHLEKFALRGMSVITSGDDTFVVDAITAELPNWSSYKLQANNAILTSNTGKRILSLEQFSASGETNGEVNLDVDLTDTMALFDLMAVSAPDIKLEIKGLDIDVMASGVAPVDVPPLKGDFSFAAKSDGETISFKYETDFQNWFQNRIASTFIVSDEPAASAKMLMALKDGDKRIEALGRTSLVSGEFGWKDLGLNAFVTSTVGMSLKELVLMSVDFGDRIPEELAKPVIEWLAEAVATEGHAVAKPAQPANLAEVGIHALMGPEKIAGAIELELHDNFVK